MKNALPSARRIELNESSSLLLGTLPASIRANDGGFEHLWRLRPEQPHSQPRCGKETKTPRWQQAFGHDYSYSGAVNLARPIPDILTPYLGWARTNVDDRLNGLLVNWYDLALRHYIGRHWDSPDALVPDAPIVTISFGAERTFRFERRSRKVDLLLQNGSVLVIPFAVNLRWSHQVPRTGPVVGRRISITARAFK